MGTLHEKKTVVLVVEDEGLIRMDAVDALSDAGFELVEASSGDQAVAILRERDDIDVVFTDVHMPGSIDGLMLSKTIHDEWPTIGVIITSGLARLVQDRLPSRTLFFQKPHEYKRIIGAVNCLTGR
ncbi:response regulator [Agrobacterium sp. Azo12]|uniref:response regulator n=1 Tax=Agrobacterium sp. Azo12 TaxID=3031129 RepID=UPI0023D84034|nr:response regulator [Agrobacterium sp. Azo12]MDO5897205.1 response regulator [Agrobacterium sp. Azo12]